MGVSPARTSQYNPELFSNVAALVSIKASFHKLDMEVVRVEGRCILIDPKWQFIRSEVLAEHLPCVRHNARGLTLLTVGKGI